MRTIIKCSMKLNYLLFIFLLFNYSHVYSQDWGMFENLNPTFSADNRFNITLNLSGTGGNLTPVVPDWTQDLILYQMRIDKFGAFPTINSAREKLDVLTKLGITGVVLNPIAKPFKWADGSYEEWMYYSHLEPNMIDPDLGTEADFKAFVTDLHARGIKVFLDFEFHGVFDRNVFLQGSSPVDQASYNAAGSQNVSSLITSHPEFFEKITDAKGTHIRYTVWNTAELMWKYSNGTINESLKTWYSNMLKDDWIKKYDLDGLRLDLEPYEVAKVVGYNYWENLIAAVKNETGKTIILIPEDGNALRNNAFAFSQGDYGVDNPRFGQASSRVKDFMVSAEMTNYPLIDPNVDNHVYPVNIVDEIKNTDGDVYNKFDTYYSSAISAHDNINYPSQGRLVYFGYGTLFQPFIPFWFMGNEFNVRKTVPADPFYKIIYFNRINWNDYTTNVTHFNEVRKMIYIRKKYKNLIGPSTYRICDKPIVKVPVAGILPDLPAYAYYNTTGDNVAILVLGTKTNAVNNIVVDLPLEQLRLNNFTCLEFHNLLTDTKQIISPVSGKPNRFQLENLTAWGNLIYKIEPCKPNGVDAVKVSRFRLLHSNDNSLLKLYFDSNSDVNLFPTSMQITDLNGKILKVIDFSKTQSLNNQELSIDVADLSSGLYFVSVNSKSERTVLKYIKY